MRIDFNNSIARQVAAERASKASSKPETSTSAAEDKASFSHSTLSLSALVEGAMTTPPARQERLSALRDAVNNGQYTVDARKTADAMLQESEG